MAKSATVTVSGEMKWWVSPLIVGATRALRFMPGRLRWPFFHGVTRLAYAHGIRVYADGRRIR